MREESFGPIIGIQKVAGDDEAIQLMNHTEYGLTAGVYTNDEARARRILAQVHAGSVYWNCCDRVSPRLPWSGVGHSGVGLTLSTYGIETFTRPKAWHLKQCVKDVRDAARRTCTMYATLGSHVHRYGTTAQRSLKTDLKGSLRSGRALAREQEQERPGRHEWQTRH